MRSLIFVLVRVLTTVLELAIGTFKPFSVTDINFKDFSPFNNSFDGFNH